MLEKRKPSGGWPHVAADNTEYDIPEAFVLYNDNVRVEGKVVYLPVYMTMFLQRKSDSNAGKYLPDISALQG